MASVSNIAEVRASEVVAKGRAELSVVELFATSRKPSKWFPGLAKKLSRDKPAAAISHLTNERERTCYDWCSGAVDPPARAVVKLLHSEVGWVVLQYLMRGCKQPWWIETEKARRCSAAYERERQVQYELEVTADQ